MFLFSNCSSVLLTQGAAFLNGFNLGRYWPVMGPQITLYVPSVLFKDENEIFLVEQEHAPCRPTESCDIEFVAQPEIDGLVPN